METNQLDFITEYLESISKDITRIDRDMASIRKNVEAQPQAKDYSLQLENALTATQAIGAQVTKLGTQVEKLIATPVGATPPLDVAALTQDIKEVVREEVKRYQPGYKVAKGVQYGVFTLIGVSLMAIITTTGWWHAVQDRNHYVRSNWFWRSFKQTDRHYANELLKVWHQDSVKFQQKIEQLEADELLLLQADRKKQEEAALRAQATHGKKK